MKSDDAIKRNVEAELSRNPEFDATDIAVNAVARLRGVISVRNSWSAPGVTNVRNEFNVRT
jgi:osmotically-inducible protein OsmY